MRGKTTKLSYVTAMSLVVALLLTACGGGSTTSNSTTAGSTSATSTSAEVKPLENVTLTWVLPADSGEPKDNSLVQEAMSAQVKDRINANIKLKWVTFDEYMDKMNVMSASNEDYDISWNGNWQSLYQMVAKNAYLDIGELLPKYAPEYYAQVPKTFWDTMKFGGKTLAMPNVQKASTKHGFYVRKDINDKYNVTGTVKSIEDLDAMFATIKKDNPTMYMIMKPADYINYNLIWNDWDNVAGNDIGAVDMKVFDSTGKIKLFNAYQTDEMKNALLRVEKWYKSGYCPLDAPVIADTDSPAKEGKVAFMATQLGPWPEKDLRNAFLGAKYAEWVPLNIGVGRQVTQTQDILGSVQTINVNSKNPERALMFLNLVNTDKLLYNTVANGIEGKNYTLTDGILSYPEGLTPDTNGYFPDCAWALGCLFNLYPTKEDGPNFFEAMKADELNAKPAPTLGFNFDPEPVASELSQCQAIIEEYVGPLFNGAVDTQKVLAELNAKMDKAGAEAVLAEKQKQVDAWVATK